MRENKNSRWEKSPAILSTYMFFNEYKSNYFLKLEKMNVLVYIKYSIKKENFYGWKNRII